jgi:hypothetical protein
VATAEERRGRRQGTKKEEKKRIEEEKEKEKERRRKVSALMPLRSSPTSSLAFIVAFLIVKVCPTPLLVSSE